MGLALHKIISHIRWFFVVIPVGFFAMVTSPIMYPLAYKFPKLFNWWLDDEIFNSETNQDYKIYMQTAGIVKIVISIKWKFINIYWTIIDGNFPKWADYKWHAFRNTMWNFKSKLKPEVARDNCVRNDEVIIEVKQDALYRNNQKVNIYGKCLEMAGFKWIDKYGNEGWQVFSGEKISYKYSNIGVSELWYKANGKLYYRYSLAKIIKILGKEFYFTFAMGTTDKRHLLNLKIQ